MKFGQILVVIFSFLFRAAGLNGQCSDQEFSFAAGEKITYRVAYNWGIVWVDAGEAYFRVDTSNMKGKTVFDFEAYGASYTYYDWVYKVRDLYRAKLDPHDFQPLWFYRNTAEGSLKIFNQYDFDLEDGQINIQIREDKKTLKVSQLPLEKCRFDVLSAVYFARNINYNNLNPGDKITVKFIIGDEFYELFIRYHGKEVIQNRSGKKYRCHKLSAMLVEGTIFKAGEDLVVWITDDRNKIPVMAEAAILIGSVKAYLTGYKGLKYPVGAEVME